MALALQQLIAGLALRALPCTAVFIHRRVVTVAQQQGWSILSDSPVSAVIRQLTRAVIALAHDRIASLPAALDGPYRK